MGVVLLHKHGHLLIPRNSRPARYFVRFLGVEKVHHNFGRMHDVFEAKKKKKGCTIVRIFFYVLQNGQHAHYPTGNFVILAQRENICDSSENTVGYSSPRNV